MGLSQRVSALEVQISHTSNKGTLSDRLACPCGLRRNYNDSTSGESAENWGISGSVFGRYKYNSEKVIVYFVGTLYVCTYT